MVIISINIPLVACITVRYRYINTGNPLLLPNTIGGCYKNLYIYYIETHSFIVFSYT